MGNNTLTFLLLIITAIQFSYGMHQSKCNLPPKPGPCQDFATRYFYNKKTRTCEPFAYGGCDGNKNNFLSNAKCEHHCHTKIKTSHLTPTERCLLPAKVGPCKSYEHRYAYDKESKQCKIFIYGGCSGNTNNFKSKAECNNKCQGLNDDSAEHCRLPLKTGSCKARMPRYFYNTETEKCESFTYTGCQGNGNNFASERECEKTCMV